MSTPRLGCSFRVNEEGRLTVTVRDVDYPIFFLQDLVIQSMTFDGGELGPFKLDNKKGIVAQYDPGGGISLIFTQKYG